METKVEIAQSNSSESHVFCCCIHREATSNARVEDLQNQLFLATRKVTLLTGVCGIFCLITIGSCIGSVASLYKIQNYREKTTPQHPINTIPENGQVAEQDPMTSALVSDAHEDHLEPALKQVKAILIKETISKRDANNEGQVETGLKRGREKGKRGKNKRRKKKKRHCPKRCRKERAAPVIPPTPLTMTTLNQSPPQISGMHLTVAHYTSYINNDFVNKTFGPLDDGSLENAILCRYISEWHGTLCRNRTFSSNVALLTLNVVRPAAWMISGNVPALFDQTTDGKFVARNTGVYLLYAHAQFFTNGREGIAIIHETASGYEVKNNLHCQTDTNFIRFTSQHGRAHACSVTGAIYIETGEIICVVLIDKNTTIDLGDNQFYFGAFFLRNTTISN